MTPLKRRETPVQSIAFIAIMVGIAAVFSLIAAFLPLSALFLMIIIPAISCLVAVYCKFRYYPIYLLGAMGLSLAISFWNFQTILFYMFPGLFTGLVYGFLYQKKAPVMLSLFVSALVQVAFFFLSLLLIKAIYEVDMPSFLLSIIGKGDSPKAMAIIPLFGFGYSLGEVALSHVVLLLLEERLVEKNPSKPIWEKLYPLIALVFLGLAVGLVFVDTGTGYFFLGLSLYWTVCSVFALLDKPSWISFVILGALFIISLFLFAFLYKKMPEGTGLILTGLFLFSIIFASTFHSCLLRKKEDTSKITKQ